MSQANKLAEAVAKHHNSKWLTLMSRKKTKRDYPEN
jgi:hypothetical protein